MSQIAVSEAFIPDIARQNGNVKIEKQSDSAEHYAKRWDHRYSIESMGQSMSPLKDSVQNLGDASPALLSTARPHAQFYPWQAISTSTINEATFAHQKPMTCEKGAASFDLSDALNYGTTVGMPQLVDFFKSFVKITHNPPYKDWDTCLSCGSTSAIDIALRMFCNHGDWIITEQFTYSGAKIAAGSHGLKTIGIRMDDDGLIPEDLDDKLSNWDSAKHGKKPFILYTIPSGQNPTGTTQSTERKMAIYQVAEKHDLFILEDDPYYHLPLNIGKGRTANGSSSAEDGSITEELYRDALPTSYLSIDTSGRVLRLDSASKILAPGLRTGWITGSSQIIGLYVAFADASTLAPSGASQAIIYKLVKERWGYDGLTKWLIHLSLQYKKRRDIVIDACEKYIPQNICQWSYPQVGMFIWIKLNLQQHPKIVSEGCEGFNMNEFRDVVEERIHQDAERKGVVTAKGSWFVVEDSEKEIFFRLSYVTAEEEELENAVRIFGNSVVSEFGIRS